MTQILKRISDPQEQTININRNFDDISRALADRSGQFSTVASAGPITVASGVTYSVTVEVGDVNNIYTRDRLPIVPRVTVYVDNNSSDYQWPDGNSLSSAQKSAITICVITPRLVVGPSDDTVKAQYAIALQNFDASSHDFYVYVDAFFVPAPESGVVSR